MKLTQEWLKKQIMIYSEMLTSLDNSEEDKTLKTIYGERVNTLQSVLVVIELEIMASQ